MPDDVLAFRPTAATPLLERFMSAGRDKLLANITLYWMTQTISFSFCLYHETLRTPLRFDADDIVHVPCGISRFPKDIPLTPRKWLERGYNVQSWTEMP